MGVARGRGDDDLRLHQAQRYRSASSGDSIVAGE
ncbi:MAG: hypothetical protein KatS3mg111_3336 [Pirellulaceae bacterium]|nr:MAG: hypothetical protein KatS3mg111_3336 [Pirellulaceae bacterium]